MQAIVDNHHKGDVKTATKVRFQEPGKEKEEKEKDQTEETKEDPGSDSVRIHFDS